MVALRYTDESIVLQRVKGSSLPSTLELQNMIKETEGYVEMLMRETVTFDETKHGVIRECVTNYVCAKVVAENPANYSSTAEASLAADIFWSTGQRCEVLLRDPKFVIWLKGL